MRVNVPATMIPDAPIKLDGFPLCAHPHNDGREVEKVGDVCALDGGKPASLDIIRRALHRQIRGALYQILTCSGCKEIPPNEIRCGLCSWYRGAAMGMGGLGEQVWGKDEFSPYMEIISTFSPGWQQNVKWNPAEATKG